MSEQSFVDRIDVERYLRLEGIEWIPDVRETINPERLLDPTLPISISIRLSYLENKYGSLEDAINDLYPRTIRFLDEIGLSDRVKDELLSGFRSKILENRVRTTFMFSVILDSGVLDEIKSISERYAGKWRHNITVAIMNGIRDAHSYRKTKRELVRSTESLILDNIKRLYEEYIEMKRFLDGDPSTIMKVIDIGARYDFNPYDVYSKDDIATYSIDNSIANWIGIRGAGFDYSIDYRDGTYIIRFKGIREYVKEIHVDKVVNEIRRLGRESIQDLYAILVNEIGSFLKESKLHIFYGDDKINGRITLFVVEEKDNGIVFYKPFERHEAGWNDLEKVYNISDELTMLFRNLAGYPLVTSPELLDTVSIRTLRIGRKEINLLRTFDNRIKLYFGGKVEEITTGDDVVLIVAPSLNGKKQVEELVHALESEGLGVSNDAKYLGTFVSILQRRINVPLIYDREKNAYLDNSAIILVSLADNELINEFLEGRKLVEPSRMYVLVFDKEKMRYEKKSIEEYRPRKNIDGELVIEAGGSKMRYPIEAANIYKTLNSFEKKASVRMLRTEFGEGPLMIRGNRIVSFVAPLL